MPAKGKDIIEGAKPKFNPQAQFEPVAEKKPAFDPNKPFEKKNLGENDTQDGGTPSPTASPSNPPLSLSERINQAASNPHKPTGFKPSTVFGQEKKVPVKKVVEQEQPTDNLFTPKNKIVAPNSIDLPVVYNWSESPQLHNEAIDKIQSDINSGNITPEVVNATAKITDKSPAAASAYLQGDATTGNAYDRTDALQKNAADLNGIIQKANADFGWNVNPAEVLGNADLTEKFLSKYLLTLQQSDPVQQKVAEAEAQGRDMDVETLNALIENDQNLKNRLSAYTEQLKAVNPTVAKLKSHIIEQAGAEGYAKGESAEETAKRIAKLTNPIQYKNAEDALKKPFGFDRLSDQSNLGDIVGAITDEVKGDKTFKDQMLNSVLGSARLELNNSYKKIAEDKAAIAHLSGDEAMMNEAKLMYSKYDKDLINKIPALQMAGMANELSRDIATQSGQLEGTDTENYRLKLAGASQNDIIALMQKKGWFDDPIKKPLAMQIANNPDMVKDASYFGGVKDNVLQPFKDLGLSLLDVTDTRTFKDRMADKFRDELFPKEFAPDETKADFTILGHDFKARHIVNGISNLAGLTVGNILTEGIAGEAGLSANAAKRLSAYTTFGIPSIDANLKDSYNFITDDKQRAGYVTMGALINGELGNILDLGKISRVPGLKEPVMLLAKNLTENNLTTAAKDEALGIVQNKLIDFAKKYGRIGLQGGKNTIEGAATMSAFGIANEYNKLLNGDPNTKAEDILPNAGSAFVDGIFTMLPFGFVRAVKETKNNPNSTYKEMINKLSVMPDAGEDIIRLGAKSPEDFNYKMSVINTARAAKNALDATEQATGVSLDPSQRSVYVANKTIEASLRNKAEKTTNEVEKEKYLQQADELNTQSIKTLDGLKFTPTLEPLYDLYDAEKRYNKAYDDFHNGVASDDKELLAAKDNYEKLQYKYFNDNKPAEEVKQPEEKTFTDFDKTLFHEGKLTPLGEEMKARIAKGEDITILTSRDDTPENKEFISRTLGIPTENIKAGLDAKAKANELTAYSGKKVFYDDNPENVAEAQTTDARVVNTGLTPEQQLVQDNADGIKNEIYRNIVKSATDGKDIDEVLKDVSDQWHDLESRNEAEDGFPKPIIEAAKKLYPQEENAGLEIKSDPEQPKVTEGSGEGGVVDDKGIPIGEGNWYHGSPIYEQGISGNDLKPNKNGLIFFTRDKNIAERYATNDYEGNTPSNNIFERKLDVKNIFDPEKNSNNPKIVDLLAATGNFENTGRNTDFNDLAKEALENGEWSNLETKEFIDGLKKIGYDAIFIDNRPYYKESTKGERTFNRDIAVFDTKQHKSVEQSLKDKSEQTNIKEQINEKPKESPQEIKYPEIKSNKDVKTAFDAVYQKLGHDDLGGILYNWNESELSEDGDKIKSYVGRDGRYSKGKEGGEQVGGKKGFIQWLLSDAPFDEKVYGKDIKNDKEWVGNIEKARKAITDIFPVKEAVEKEAQKVKKENEPITVYRSGEVNSDTPYFAETKEYADKFGEQKGTDVSEVKINPKNVLDITEDYSENTSPKEVQKLLEDKGVEFADAEKRSIESFEDNYKGDPTFSHIANIPAFTEAIKRSGFDAVKQKEGLPNAEGKFDELHPSYLVTDPSIIMDEPSRKAAEAEAVRKQYLADKQKEVGYQEFSNNNDRYQREAERAKREYLSGKKENVFDALDKAAESKKSVREKERAMENAAAEMGEDGKRALAINKNFEDILKHLKENKKIEIKCP